MPTTALTTDQLKAIETRSVSVALSAGAGCGKTHVLTERFLSHLIPDENGKSQAHLTQLVAITFTDAAAREMRSRIRRACYDRLVAAESQNNQNYWQLLLREIDTARISTIHAFCSSLLRAHAAVANLDPTFSVLDQGEADLLQYDTTDDVLRDELERLDDDTLQLASTYGLTRLKQQIAALLAERKQPAFQEWLTKTPEESLDAWHQFHTHEAFPLALRSIAEEAPLEEIITLLGDVETAGKKPEFLQARAALLEMLPRLKKAQLTPAELQVIRECARVSGLCTAKDWTLDAYEDYKNSCTELRKVIDRHLSAEFDRQAALPTARLGIALLHITARIVEKYRATKHSRGALDFDDLLAAAYHLIADSANSALRQKLADDLRLLLVDEFQDTDQLQVDLVRALCGDGFETGRLFFVGDFKQSIYRFRGAKPKVFRELREQIHETGRLPLTKNFRSQPAILHFVNALFYDAFADGHQYEPLCAHRPQTTETPSVEFLWTITPDKNNRRIAGAALEARRNEAQAIARRIRWLLDDQCSELPVVDSKTHAPRRLKPGDVAILFRALSDVQVYEDALRQHGLDYYLVGGHAFYAQQEIYDVLNLLRSIASTADEVSLAGVLRSPFFALEDETLFWLVESAGSLNAGLLGDRPPRELGDQECTKVAVAADTFRHLRAIKDRVPIARLFGEALDRTGYDAVLLTEFLGQRKLANLHKIAERARAADESDIDLDGFITQLAQYIAREPKEALAATLPEAADVIRLMTIHQAKGLEFPLVIVADLDRRPLLNPPAAALHPQLGPLVPAAADDDKSKCVTGMKLFAAVERAEELEERKRLLYVAATRAADSLILSSSLENYDKPQSDWMKLLSERFDLESGQLLGNLPDGFTRPTIRSSPEPPNDYKTSGKPRGPDLLRMLDEARELAAAGESIAPREVTPVPVCNAARRTFSFSRLTGALVHPDDSTEDELPSIHTRKPGDDSLALGRLVHDVLARVDFSKPDDIAKWCQELAPLHLVHNVNSAAESARKMIVAFVTSPQGQTLARAATIHREIEFLLAWPIECDTCDPAAIRGYIDCLYQDTEGNWRIADFKTNQVTAAEVSRRAKDYELQLYVYALAAERALGHPPAELALHFLRPTISHIVPWNKPARRQAAETLNQAIAQVLK